MKVKVAFSFAFCSRVLSQVAAVGARRRHVHHLQQRQMRSLFCGSISSTTTMKEAYDGAFSKLATADIPDPENSARYLLCDVLDIGYRYSEFLDNQSKIMTASQLLRLEEFISRRLKREPVQYIIGNWDFCSHTFICEPPVLIPRPETEELVEMIIQRDSLSRLRSSSQTRSQVHILDIGTGTGAIAISLLAALPFAKCTAIDINEACISLAQRNAALILGNEQANERFEGVVTSYEDFARNENNRMQFDLIVSNPPYIPSQDMISLQEEVKNFEDERALDGGLNGMDIITQIINTAYFLLSPDGTRELWMEVDTSHPAVIESSCRSKKQQYEVIEGKNDLSGNPRFVTLIAKKK